jgi:hypothetical protein
LTEYFLCLCFTERPLLSIFPPLMMSLSTPSSAKALRSRCSFRWMSSPMLFVIDSHPCVHVSPPSNPWSCFRYASLSYRNSLWSKSSFPKSTVNGDLKGTSLMLLILVSPKQLILHLPMLPSDNSCCLCRIDRWYRVYFVLTYGFFSLNSHL